MSVIPYLLTCLALAVFIVSVAARIKRYLNKPLHVRWELYPVAHDAERASYGGSYLEDVDWWKKPRKKSMMGELSFMVPEILLLRGVWENNRSLWYRSYPFHLGLYLTAAFMGLVFLGGVLELFGFNLGSGSVIGSIIIALTNVIGPAGFLLAICGAVALFHRRISDSSLREYSSFGHFFSLALFIVVMATAIATWLFADPGFAMARSFAAGLVGMKWSPIPSHLFTAQIVLGAILLAYIPITHMSHFFMKYFLWHDIRWGDEPNIDKPATDRKIGEVLNYPVTWSAPHIAISGKKTWAEIATHNPMAETENTKE